MWLSTRTLLVAMLGVLIACSRPKPAPEGARDVPNERIREPAVAGTFYPSDPDELRKQVESLLRAAPSRGLQGLRGLISPHAGYRYSGPVAASGFKQLMGSKFERVVLFAPSHHVAFRGVAIPDVDALRTPFGKIRLSHDAKALAQHTPFVIDSAPHQKEHSLEVELPFLQATLGPFEVVPLVFGDTDEAKVAQRVEQLSDPRTFFVASSDLSHYHPYERAQTIDELTVQAILRLDLQAIEQAEACGKGPILAMVHLARLRGWKASLLDRRNSGDITGDRSRVVGYASIAFLDPRE